MNRMNGTIRALTVAGLITAATAYGGLVGSPSISSLSQNADAIVVGSASGSIQAEGAITFSINVARVLKGLVTPGASITVGWDNSHPGDVRVGNSNSTMAATGNGIWFLKQVPGGWSLLLVAPGTPFQMTYYPASLSSPVGVYSYPQSATLQDKLTSELGAAIESAPGYNFQLYSLLNGGLDQLNSPIVNVLYQRLAESASTQKQMLGTAGLIRSGSIVGLTSAISLAPSLTGDTSIEFGKLLFSIREQYRQSDPTSIALLGQAATDSTNQNTAFRVVVAHALAAIHNTAALPFLTTLLDDSNPEIRAEGIGGIGAFALGLPVQNLEGVPSMAFMQPSTNAPFRNADTIAHFGMGLKTIQKNEAFYLSFWKNWWMQNRASLGL